ncbi:MAG: exodeoxyribonuclease V subunit gamma [Leptospirales bacterium]|nr:exodeoxyribonuclease V subunit gamma [Leptospirales bacterium]
MAKLTLFSGNRLEALADKFAEIISSSPLPAMERELIVVQSLGMMRWISLEMSRRLGIWSNYEYIFPNKMTGLILNSFFPDRCDKRFFDKDIMTWKCIDIILREKDNPHFSEISSYIDNDIAGIKLYQLASKIIDLFDQYMTFRPEMIIQWDTGAMKGEWQPELWRLLTSSMSNDHPPALLYDVYNTINSKEKFVPTDFHKRFTVFGISYLPVYHINMLRAVANYSDVNIFILNPSPEYWDNILTEKEKRKIISASPVIPDDITDYLHIEGGNELLSSLGRVGRDFLHNLFMSDIETEEQFVEPQRDSLLSMIQHDIYMMQNGPQEDAKNIFSEEDIVNDRSITISSCHSIMREVEILHDYILDLLNKDSSLAPWDILIMSPNIAEYSSCIQMIFGHDSEGIPRIPFKIVDRKIKDSSPVLETFFKILSLNNERFTSAYILSIADCIEIREKFNLSREDMDKIGRWVKDCAVYWGIDSRFKEELSLPGVYENTWRFGLDRMLMGSIMYDENKISLGILPYSEIEGSDLLILGRFISFFNSLRDIYYMLKRDYTIYEWSDVINTILDLLFAAETSSQLSAAYTLSLKLKDIHNESRFDEKVNVRVIYEFFEKFLSAESLGGDFAGSNLIFCEMLPMRSIPKKIICIIGMNDSAFPRKSGPLSFDMMSAYPKRGDRSIRDEDRFLFLETLISARENLYISYIGKDINTGTELNPSIVVSELIEYIKNYYKVNVAGKNIVDYIFKTHRIQSYNPVYFISDSGFFTYQGSKLDGAKSYAKNEKTDFKFINESLPTLTDDEKNITVNELAQFLVNPAKWVMNRRLGLYLTLRSDEYIAEEPFTLDSLDLYRLNSEIMKALLREDKQEDHLKFVQASGILPHGKLGVVAYEQSLLQVKIFYDKFKSLLCNKSPKRDISISIDDMSISGAVDNIYDGKCIFFRYASENSLDILISWITHLLLLSSGSFSGETILLSKTGIKKWGEINNSKQILSTLLNIYRDGMRKPIPLFPRSSLKYAETFYDGKPGEPGDRALKSAETSFNSTYFTGDSDDPYIRLFFGESYILSKPFTDITMKVYSSIFENFNSDEII